MRLILFALFTLVASPAFADLSTLMASLTRPTIADVERETTDETAPLPQWMPPSAVQSPFMSQLNAVADMIAELEWAYPGAVYMPLGRDIVLVGDAIDAFYRAHGQPGRIIRLNASGRSLDVGSVLIARWIESSGVDIKNLANSRGYIPFDGSNYGPSSQSTTILSAVYEKYVHLGGNASDLVDKFAFFNTARGNGAAQVNPGLDRESILKEERQLLATKRVSIPRQTFASSRPLRGQSEWHSNFLRIQTMPDGSVIAPSPEPNPEQTRAYILAEMRAIMKATAAPEFLELVRDRARKLGYEFPIAPSCQDLL